MSEVKSRFQKINEHVFSDAQIVPLQVGITCVQMNCHAMDFDNILAMHLDGIEQARAAGSKIVCFPELSLCGYGCEDHFFESDTEMHCWCSVKTLIQASTGLMVDVGMPVAHRGCRFNCRVLIMDCKILGIRPKCFMAQEGVYRELRYFTPWQRNLMDKITVDGFGTYPFGIFYIKFADCRLGVEICEEMWTPKPVHVDLFLNGVDIVLNSSGSCHCLGKLDIRRQHVLGASMRRGGVYVYTNFSGNDGGLLCFDGASYITVNGNIVKEGPSLSITNDVECIHGSVDIQQVRNSMVTKNSAGIVAMEHIGNHGVMYSVDVDEALCTTRHDRGPDWPETPRKYSSMFTNVCYPFGIHTNISECLESLKGIALWMWDFLRRCSGSRGFFVPLSGGADSGATVGVIYFMCEQLIRAIANDVQDVIRDVSNVLRMDEKEVRSLDIGSMMRRICTTAYISTARSGELTKNRAKELVQDLNTNHLEVDLESPFQTFRDAVSDATGKALSFKIDGGMPHMDIALQNLQARLRMVMSYSLASTIHKDDKDDRFLIVVATGNASETLSGYFTKYDCSSGDINPIGSLSKREIYDILQKLYDFYGFQSFQTLAHSKPTAELRPNPKGQSQTDEADMGLTYADLSRFAYLRGVQRCGPVQAYLRSVDLMPEMDKKEVARKVKHFFNRYANNRHKTSVRTPSYQFKLSSPEDSRNDHRQLLYPSWTRQFRVIDAIVNRQRAESVLKEAVKEGE